MQEPNGHEDPVQIFADEIKATEDEIHSFNQRAYMIYAARWAIGLTLTGFITWYWPELHWLWWTALAIAALSLLFLFLRDYAVCRKVARSEACIAESRGSISGYEDGDSGVR